MDYNTILKAIKNRLEYVPAASQELQDDLIMGGYQTESDFEDIMCEYVDALNELKRIRNVNRRKIISYSAMGYHNWEIAKMLGMTENGVDWHIREAKRFFKNN